MQQSAESLLEDWQALDLPFTQRPRIDRELQGGKTNRSYLLQADGERWVLRLDGPGTKALGIDREREMLIHRAAAAAGLAPDLIHCDRQRGIAITKFVDGSIIAPGALKPAQLQSILSAWSELGELKVAIAATNYRDLLVALRAGTRRHEPFTPLLEDAIARLEDVGSNSLCHHDLVPGNVLFTPRGVVLIDWEYAGPGVPALDLATVVVDWRVSPTQICEMLDIQTDLLDAAIVVYRYMCELWAARQRALALLGGEQLGQ